MLNIDVSDTLSDTFFRVKHKGYKLFETKVRFIVSALYSPEESTTNCTALFHIIIFMKLQPYCGGTMHVFEIKILREISGLWREVTKEMSVQLRDLYLHVNIFLWVNQEC
jgi:hypothetical protein